MAVSMYTISSDKGFFWRRRLKKGQVEPPKPAYVPIEEEYDETALKNILREWYGRHCCPACGKPYFLMSSAFDCHPEASAYKVWGEFANRGPAGARSLEDAIRAEISNPYGGFGSYYSGGPYGL